MTFDVDKITSITNDLVSGKEASKPSSIGWAENIQSGKQAADLLKNAEVLADLRAFYKERDGDDYANDEDLVNKFYSDRTNSASNTGGASYDLGSMVNMSDDQLARFGRVQKLYDALPNFYEDGGRGIKGLAQHIAYGAVDPLNIIGFGVGGAAGRAAMKTAVTAATKDVAHKAAMKAAMQAGNKAISGELRGQIIWRSLVEGAKAGAIAEGKAGLLTGGVQSAITQARDVGTGIQDEFSVGQLAKDTLTEGAASAGLGGIFGGVGAMYGGKISRAMTKVKDKVVGDFGSKYTTDAPQTAPISETVESAKPDAPKDEKAADIVTGYISNQREQYQRNLDAVIDSIREESGEGALSEWRLNKVADADKTEAMKIADKLQATRTALNDLYNWPKLKASYEAQLERMSQFEAKKPEQIKVINDLTDKINIGEDAYQSIVRAAEKSDIKEFDKIVDDFAGFAQDKDAFIFDPATGETFKPVKQAQAEASPFTPSLTNEAIPSVDQQALSTELEKIAAAEDVGQTVDQEYKQAVQAKYKELAGVDFVRKPVEPEPDVSIVETSNPDYAEAISSLNKKYSSISNKISRLSKKVESNTATPEMVDQLKQLNDERANLVKERRDLKQRADDSEALNATTEEVQQPVVVEEPVTSAISEVADIPLNVDGAAEFLQAYGYDKAFIKKQLADHLKGIGSSKKKTRAAALRSFAADMVEKSRAMEQLSSLMDSIPERTHYTKTLMHRFIDETNGVSKKYKQQAKDMYDSWLDSNSQNLLARYLGSNPELEIDDVVAIISDDYGEEAAQIIMDSLIDDSGVDLIKYMSVKKPSPAGWDQLTPRQRETIDTHIENARKRMLDPNARLKLSHERVDGLLAAQKANMVMEQLYNDLAFAFERQKSSSISRASDPSLIIKDPDTGGNVSGKVWTTKVGSAMPTVAKSDRRGLQSVLNKATSGRATGIDEFGDVIIEYPYWGSLLVRDIKRNSDGSIDLIKTTDGKYLEKTLPDGRTMYIRKRFSAADTAAEEMLKARVDAATGRIVKVSKDLPGLKAGQKGVTEKQLKAAEVESLRQSGTLEKMTRQAFGTPVDAAAEEASKNFKQSVRKVVIKEAVQNAIATSETPVTAASINIKQAEEVIGESVSMKEMESVWGDIEAEDRLIATAATKEELLTDAHRSYQVHGDQGRYIAEIQAIMDKFSPKSMQPKPTAVKPRGTVQPPLVYVHKGFEVDVNNHFTRTKTSDGTYAIKFLGKKVGDVSIAKDGSATVMYKTPDGLEATVKGSSTEEIKKYLPRIFNDDIIEAGEAGLLNKAATSAEDATFPIDWQASNTYDGVKETVPSTKPVDEPAKIIGQVLDWKTNKNASAVNIKGIPDGHVLAIQIQDGQFKHTTRVENTLKDTPQTIGMILGKQSDKAYTVGYVPSGTKSGTIAATREFVPLDPSDPHATFDGGGAKSAAVSPESLNKSGQVRLSDASTIDIDPNDLPTHLRGSITKLSQLHNEILKYQNFPWSSISSIENYRAFVADIKALYAARAKYAPNGIELPNASRMQSMRQWERVMEKQDSVTIATGMDVLRRLAFNDRPLPIIESFNQEGKLGAYHPAIAGAEKANRILMDNSTALGVVPKPVVLLHEVAHWAYDNVLSDADRMAFWDSIEKYFVDGKLDIDQVRQRLPGVDQFEDMSPQEFFANQFSQWAVSNQKVNNIPLWQKMAQRLVKVAAAFGVRFSGDKSFASAGLVDVDFDLIDIFSKILPESDPMYSRYEKAFPIVNQLRSIKKSKAFNMASLAVKVMTDFDDLRASLDRAIETASPTDLENALDDAAKHIYGKVGGKGGAMRHVPTRAAGSGQARLRMFDGKKSKLEGWGSTGYARRELLNAQEEWRKFKKAKMAEEGLSYDYRPVSTADIAGTLSGDLASSFDTTVDIEFSKATGDYTADLQRIANRIINALAFAQDEAASIASRAAASEGINLKIEKTGKVTIKETPSFVQNFKARSAARTRAKKIAEEKYAEEIISGKSSIDTRDRLQKLAPAEEVSSTPVSKMKFSELQAEIRAHAGKKKGQRIRDVEAELRNRIYGIHKDKLTEPTPELMGKTLGELEKLILSSIKSKKQNPEGIKSIINAIAWKKQQALDEPLLTPKNIVVQKAVAILKDNAAIGTTDNGTPINMAPQPRAVVSSITHRNRADESAARVTAERIFALIGKGNLKDDIITKSDLSKALGLGDADADPVHEGDELFKKFREEMRGIATDLKTQAGAINAFKRVSSVAIRLLPGEQKVKELGTNVDELASAITAVARGKATIDDVFSDLPESSRRALADITHDVVSASSVMLTGLGNRAARGELQYMSAFGNLLSELSEKKAFFNASRQDGKYTIHPELAGDFIDEFFSNMSSARRFAVENFTGTDAESSVLYENIDYDGGALSPSVRSTSGEYGTGVYLSKSAEKTTQPNGDFEFSATSIRTTAKKLKVELANMEAMKLDGIDTADFRVETIIPLVKALERYMAQDNMLVRMYNKSEQTLVRRVMPYLSSANSPITFSKSSEYSFGADSANSLDWLLNKLEIDGVIDAVDADQLRSSPYHLTGDEAYSKLRDAVSKKSNSHKEQAAEAINKVLADAGYDSIDTGDAVVVFDSAKIRHIEDPKFATEEYMLSLPDTSEAVPFSGRLMEAAMDGKVNREDTSSLAVGLQYMGAPSIIVDPLKNVFKNPTRPSADAINKISWVAKTFTDVFGENSQRIRQNGAKFFADKIKPLAGPGFYDKLDTEIAKALNVSKDDNGRPISILTKARQLPDAKKTAYKRWMDRNKFIGEVEPPASHVLIVNAIRMGDEYVAKLPKAAREVALDAQKFFRVQMAQLIEAGLPIGYRKNYMPQIYNVEKILSDPNGFVKMMTDYFVSEMRNGLIPIPTNRNPIEVAEGKAIKLMRVITEEPSNGVLLPESALRTKLEDPFYERVINFNPSQVKDASRFLINDIEGMMVKYAEQVTRRKLLTKEFGIGNHAVHTYLNVLSEGRDAAVAALRGTKEMSTERRAIDEAIDERVVVTSEIIRGIEGTAEEVGELVDKAIQMLGSSPAERLKNKEKVRNFLINLQDPQIVAVQPEFLKRVDAIVNGLVEFGGKPSGIPGHELEHMSRMVAALAKKPFMTPNARVEKFSRAVKTFNNITMLPFTTLASIPDVGMASIRSGNIKAVHGAWKQYLSDPYYREAARNLGVGIESILHEKVAHMYNDSASRASNAFFNLTMLNPWTNMNREVAALIGVESFKAEARRAQDFAVKGLTNSNGYKTAVRYLERYGLERYAMPGAPVIDSSQLYTNDALRYATMRFTNEAIFAPNPNDIPMWAHGPWGSMVMQLKSYPLMMGRMAKYIANEATEGNFRPLAMMMGSVGLLGTSTLAIRDVVQQRGDNDGDGKAEDMLRDRYGTEQPVISAAIKVYNKIAEDAGLDVREHGTADMVIGWLAESFMIIGGFGLFADLLHSAVESSDNGAYGKIRTAGAVFGPSFSLVFDALDVVNPALQMATTGEAKSGDVRSMARTALRKVPIAGGISSIREPIVDAIQEKKKPGRKSNDDEGWYKH